MRSYNFEDIFQNFEEDNFSGVAVKNGHKSFGRGNLPVLRNFSLNIPKGAVYSLVGNSGCGKTVAISCILGYLKLDKGEVIYNMGSGTNFHSSKLEVGYMPQEMSLYTELSIDETLQYFGMIFGVEEDVILGKIYSLRNLLVLPDKNVLVGKLSGGEQRRVSLAVALIHEPKFLILDEPTSGVDPLLRVKIWQHLKIISKMNSVTVLVTTHSTEDAKGSDLVGVMKDGQIIAEDNPEKLMQISGRSSLDEAILSFWKGNRSLRENLSPSNLVIPYCHRNCEKNAKSMRNGLYGTKKRVGALVWKNWVSMRRNLTLLCFVTVIPAVITLITCTTFRNEPQNIPLGIVNHEAIKNNETCSSIYKQNDDDNVWLGEMLSCKFWEQLNLSKGLRPISFQNEEVAYAAVRSGKSYGVLIFPENFTDAFVDRALMISNFIEHEDYWKSSTINVHLDQTNSLVYATLFSTLHEALEKFTIEVCMDCGISPEQGSFPLKYKSPPLVGSTDVGILDYVTPGFSFGWLFFFPLISTSIRLIGEKKQGTMSRTLTPDFNKQNTKLWEFLLSYLVTELAVIIVQAVLTYVIMTDAFSVGNNNHVLATGRLTLSSSSILAIALYIFGGISGACCGCLLGRFCSEEIQAALLSIAIFFPNSFISGLVWPVEGMPVFLQKISPFLPFTLPSEALRSLMSRNWEFTHPSVWPGFLVVAIYTILYIVLLIKGRSLI